LKNGCRPLGEGKIRHQAFAPENATVAILNEREGRHREAGLKLRGHGEEMARIGMSPFMGFLEHGQLVQSRHRHGN